jgi:uncharacterized protein YgiM (DUF1202 family)
MNSRWIRPTVLGCIILLMLGFVLPGQALAAITCTVRVAKLNLRAAPSTSATIQAVLNANTQLSADARTQAGGRTWLQVTVAGKKGWVDASLVQGCTPSTLPQVQPPTGGGNPPANGPTPTPAPFVVSYTPAPNAGGADNRALLIPRDVRPGVDGIPVFRDYLIIRLDPERLAEEYETEVERVEFRIEQDQNSDEVYYTNSEGSAPYCLFKNSGNTCDNIWLIAQTDGRWPQNGGEGMRPSNRRVDPSLIYRGRITAYYENGSRDDWSFSFRIVPPGTAPSASYVTPSLDSFTPNGDYTGEVRIQSDTLASLDALAHYRGRMVFQLVVHNGSGRDGDGVGQVVFTIREAESQQVVYQHTERSRPYCVFGDSGSTCDTVWQPDETDFQWPDSDPESGVEPGQPVYLDTEYSATMSVFDREGNAVGEWTFYFDFVE